MRHRGNGEPAAGAWEPLYRAEYDGMVRLAYTILRDQAQAEDVVQDAFVEVSRRIDEVRRPGAFLRTAVVNRCRSVLRRRQVAERHHEPPPHHLESHEAEMWEVLSTLTADQRLAIVLRYYGNWRTSEIAAALGVPGSTIRSHLRRGLASLKKELGA